MARPNSSSTSFSNITPVNNALTQYQGSSVNNSWDADSANPPTTNHYKNILKIGDYLFLPAAGYRRYYDGQLRGRGSCGYYWSSTGNGWNMYFINEGQYMENTIRSDGFSVRCVQAE
jgi:hypothetical protein